MAYYRCQCGYETNIHNASSILDGEMHCRKCGLSTFESEAKISSDLTNMMASFNIDTIRNQSHDVSMPPTPQVVPQQASITYITQHYTAPVASQQYSEATVSDALTSAGVNVSALLPSQIQLFRHAQPDQQARLIELWRIAPPTHRDQLLAKNLGNWRSTSLEMEEMAARARWKQAEDASAKNPSQDMRDVVEPYMVNGYQKLAYLNVPDILQHDGREEKQELAEQHGIAVAESDSREWWRMSEMDMENQYGRLQQMHSLHNSTEDEEML